MPVSKTTDNGNTTISISYTETTDKVDKTASNAAKQWYLQGYTAGIELGERTVDDLTNQEITSVIDLFVLTNFRKAARQYHIEDSVKTTKVTASDEIDNLII